MVCSPIRAARRRLGLSRDGLGRLIGVSGRTVSYWEKGTKRPGPERADALRNTLGLSELELWQVQHRAVRKWEERKRPPW